VGAGNRYTWTYSAWFKQGNSKHRQMTFLSQHQDVINWHGIYLNSDRIITYLIVAGTDYGYYYNRKLSDRSQWYHICSVYDTTEATASNRWKTWINNELLDQSDLLGTYGDPPQNTTGYIQMNLQHEIGYSGDGAAYTDGYLAEVHFIEDTAYAPTDFGESKNGIWVPKKFTGSHATDGFHLDFADSADLGNDVSGNNNDWTSSGLATNDQVEDTPTNNWVTFIEGCDNGSAYTLANGNLQVNTTVAGVATPVTNYVLTTGKWYVELTNDTDPAVGNFFGIFTAAEPIDGTQQIYTSLGSVCYYSQDGNKYLNGAATAYGSAWGAGVRVAFALDVDGQTIEFYRNNVSQGQIDISSYDTGDGWYIGFSDASGGGTAGQGTLYNGANGFTYTPPTGFKAINWTNVTTAMQLKESLYLEGNKGFDTRIYTGDGTDPRGTDVINDLEFSPDFTWIKSRDVVRSLMQLL
jgi:hypothetical protein